MLASAGVVKGKKVTSFFSIKDDMTNAGGQWSDSEVVVDGSLITSRKPDDLPAFCREIVRALAKTPSPVRRGRPPHPAAPVPRGGRGGSPARRHPGGGGLEPAAGPKSTRGSLRLSEGRPAPSPAHRGGKGVGRRAA
jgi:hypothetical protein